MTKFGDELGVVEIDLFIVIADALKHGITPKEIDAAYRSACSQALNKSRAGRPKGSPGKGKKIEHNLERMREALVADPDKLVFTSAREVSESVPARERVTAHPFVI